MPFWAVLSIAGLTFQTLGAVLLAVDLLPTRKRELEPPGDLRILLLDVVRAVQQGGTKQQKALHGVHAELSALALHNTASTALEFRRESRLRRAGKVGLIIVAIGYFAQLVGTALQLKAA